MNTEAAVTHADGESSNNTDETTLELVRGLVVADGFESCTL